MNPLLCIIYSTLPKLIYKPWKTMDPNALPPYAPDLSRDTEASVAGISQADAMVVFMR